jgi:DNA-binding CsgD family transcriptional regulator
MVLMTGLIFAGSTLLGFGTIGLAYGLQRRFRHPFVGYYFIYLLAAAVYGFFNWIGPYLTIRIFDPAEERSFTNIILIFGMLSLPFLIVKIYFLMSLLFKWMDKKALPVFKAVLWIFGLVILMMFVADARLFWLRSEYTPGRGNILIVGYATVIVQIVLFLMPPAERILRPKGRRIAGLNTFCILNLIGFGLYVYSAYAGKLNVTPLLYFIVLLVPLLYVWALLLKNPEAGEGNEPDMHRLMTEDYGFTPREIEIVELVLKGRNNRQIGRQLFLSLQSVKNALTRIYRKAGVGSRSQLMSLLMRRDLEG